MQPSDRNTRPETSAPAPARINSGSEWPAAPIVGSLVVWSALSGGEAVIVATTKLILAMTIYTVAMTICDVLKGRVEFAGRMRQAFAGSRILRRRRR
ncbi:hypothetical protein HBB06_16055 [Streptomyces sp. SNU607]|uniref:hypothetical protein n=1 Tax=Streptomyces sp. SNU607 TaxID=2718875 RepID=UPI0026E10C97|nr:hypothetical protein [Streptomyces sp. SNU607]WKV79541.1 hypothetical protein HBB06_16055 [Streptomyces sp. SNU607]